MKIVFYGDSTVWGLDGQAFVQNGGQPQVAVPIPACVKVPCYTVENKAVCSSDSGSRLATWETEMEDPDICVVVINYCLNDCVTHDYTTYVANMRSLRDIAMAAGKMVVFMTPHYACSANVVAMLPNNVLNMKAIAAERGCGLIDLYTYSQSLVACAPDGIHPNQFGYIQDGCYVNAYLNTLLS